MNTRQKETQQELTLREMDGGPGELGLQPGHQRIPSASV